MKRRNIILVFAVMALLLIGIGYAALSDSLTIGGTVSTSEANIALNFVEAECVKPNDAATMTFGDKDVELGASLTKAGDSVEFTLVVQASADAGLNVKVTGAEVQYLTGEGVTDQGTYFSVTYSGIDKENGNVLENEGKLTIKVLITLNQTPDATTGPQTAKFSFKVNGTAVQAN